ncbi:hypothetical protein D9619_004010 [Psilocybe cf. subviscida]|uniref:alpha-amylase n=1 Tax=Psilocybe cf. subviscida TaxID=2480587 RepID=A0A8H5F871_9AGAR|nr:hypothetical protein D9619_004010 [Psilocybe cf. subviscida]
MLSSVLPLLLVLSTCAESSLAATAEQWRGRSIYQLVTDRFARADNISAQCNTGDRKYCGGSWKGVMSHLDYIQGLGFDAVWISPVVENIDGESFYGEAYHGYWTKDLNDLNSHFGTADDLKALSDALHARNMYLMVDIVVNHVAAIPTKIEPATSTPSIDYSVYQSPLDSSSSFHPFCFIDFSLNNQTDVEQCWLGDANVPLPDLDTEDNDIVQMLNTWVANLTKTYNIDGLRIDTVKHIRKDFWPDFAKSSGVYTLGEVLDNRLNFTVDYTSMPYSPVLVAFFTLTALTDVIDGILDYPTYFSVINGFGSPSGNLSTIPDVVGTAQKTYHNALLNAGSFLENHDQPRFPNITKDAALVRNAVTWPFIQDGLPILYYGQEQGYDGSTDPNNREALWFSGYQTDNKPLVTHVQTLNKARKLAISANSNFLSSSLTFIPQSGGNTLAVSKPPMLSLLTNAGASASTQPVWAIPASAGLFSANEQLVDVLTCTALKADGSGGLTVSAKGGMPMVVLPASKLQSNANATLCPNVAAGAATAGSSGALGIISQVSVGGAFVVAAALAAVQHFL